MVMMGLELMLNSGVYASRCDAVGFDVIAEMADMSGGWAAVGCDLFRCRAFSVAGSAGDDRLASADLDPVLRTSIRPRSSSSL
jgi:hypothetical protein